MSVASCHHSATTASVTRARARYAHTSCTLHLLAVLTLRAWCVACVCLDLHVVDSRRHQPVQAPADLRQALRARVQGQAYWPRAAAHLCHCRVGLQRHGGAQAKPIGAGQVRRACSENDSTRRACAFIVVLAVCECRLEFGLNIALSRSSRSISLTCLVLLCCVGLSTWQW